MVVVIAAAAVPFIGVFAGGPQLAANPTSSGAGSTIAVSGQAFAPKSQIQLAWDGAPSNLPKASVNGLGAFKVKITVPARSEERRVGKECRSRWSPYH